MTVSQVPLLGFTSNDCVCVCVCVCLYWCTVVVTITFPYPSLTVLWEIRRKKGLLHLPPLSSLPLLPSLTLHARLTAVGTHAAQCVVGRNEKCKVLELEA